ncbi:hypothetical protein F5051DRAFT_417392 [Lentinula edodes]|nr:hypothetical protein F5051DRAFT_417392 [Lentinula edodes]
MALNGTRIPPLSARVGQACYSCFAEPSVETNLSRCSKCRSVSYCSPECQQRDWISHKAFCKTLYAIEHDSASKTVLVTSLSVTPSLDCFQKAIHLINLAERSLNRPLNAIERNLIAYEPKCLSCSRSNRILRMENSDPQANLQSCPQCRLAFYCSDEHWGPVAFNHMSTPCEDGYRGLSQCELNQNLKVDARFARIMGSASGPVRIFQWAPERLRTRWIPLPEEGDWDKEYGDELRSMAGGGGPPLGPFLRGSSEGLSFPLTILYALQNLNNDDVWTQRKSLTIHILGASLDKEFSYSSVFEEILHRLPKVQSLTLLLCGPDLKGMTGSTGKAIDMDTCPNCVLKGHKRIHHFEAKTYHEYARGLGDKFVKPDFAIAFNSGLSQEAVASWAETIRFLVAERIPTAFTSYNRDEAEAEANILRNSGANLVLGPKRNPWGSQMLIPEPNKVTGFFASNSWVCGGFQ